MTEKQKENGFCFRFVVYNFSCILSLTAIDLVSQNKHVKMMVLKKLNQEKSLELVA